MSRRQLPHMFRDLQTPVPKHRYALARVLGAAAIAFVLAFGPAKAGSDALFAALKAAETEHAARLIEAEIWEAWVDTAPSDKINALTREAMRKRSQFDFEGARLILNDVVEKAPDYAEGWNQRAFVLFLQQKYDAALSDLDKALALEPRHFGAMSGKARILMGQGRVRLGQKVLREAVALYPFIRERHMLIPLPDDENTEPVGQPL
ncbi:tetratricopeptide repeat protein [Stappia sp. ES.058]|uniref:tetratricopeptide repeat protein n=1 Tax=Stappia sp. ES.058 TaxID=1881061 RepID=UPI000879CD17|nr:tetratricopeptide repeat protein [Stappia sp. ES.058]SDU26745.1 Tetratricopeptide repeat-containing protein [Stappia sp. ES.058]